MERYARHSGDVVFGEFGVLRLRRFALERPAYARGARAFWYVGLTVAAGLMLAVLGSRLYASRPAQQSPPPARQSLEDLRSTVLAARERAVKADAASLAVDAFSGAQAKAVKADRLATAQDLAAAAQAYKEAAERYGDEERQAHLKRQRVEAETARVRMAAARQRARPDSPDFAAALGHERQGHSMFERLAFKEAATSFDTAAELFAKAFPKREPPVQDPRAEIRALLNDYVRALESKDLTLLRRVRPGLTDDELNHTRASFEVKRSQKVDLRVYEITVTGEEAQALGRREDSFVLRSGQRFQTETRVVFTLKRGPRGWVIDGLQESADRPADTRAPGVRAPRRSDPVSGRRAE